jgi:hypothetical protein
MPPQLSINELYALQHKKKQMKTVAFDRVIELIHKRIRNVSSYGGLNTFYEVPGLLLGYPLYDIVDCTKYITEALRKNGFLVQLLPPPHFCVIYVSWDPSDIGAPKLPTKNQLTGIDTGRKKVDGNDVKQQLMRLF